MSNKHWRFMGNIGEWLMKKDYLKAYGEAVLPPKAKVVISHGKPDPLDVVNGPYKLRKRRIVYKVNGK